VKQGRKVQDYNEQNYIKKTFNNICILQENRPARMVLSISSCNPSCA